jgi:hypothetical protein
MEAGANEDKPRKRGWILLFIGAIIVVGAAAVILSQSSDDSSPASSKPQVVLVYEEGVEVGHCEGPQIEPSEIKLGCGKLMLTGLDWSNWGSPAAIASGTAQLNDCSPNCEQGALHQFPVTIALTRVTTCKTDGQRRYQNLNVTYLRGKHADFSSTYPCPLTKAQEKSNANAQLIAELAIKAKGGSVDHRYVYTNRSTRDPEWVRVTGETTTEPTYGWTVVLKSTDGEWAVRYAGFDEEGEEHFVPGAPCDLQFANGAPSC